MFAKSKTPALVESEDDLHMTVRKALGAAIGEPGFTSRLGVLWYSVETRNAGGKKIQMSSGAWVPLEAINRKNRGCVSGIPDIQLFYEGRVFMVELKRSKNGRTSGDQNRLHEQYGLCGIPVVVCRSVSEVLWALAEWGIPIRARLI